MLVTIDREAMRSARERKGLTRMQAAKRIELSTFTLRDMERGRHQPSLATAYKMAKAYGCTIEDLVQVQP